MPSNLIKIVDTPPVYGMNTVDDPTLLKDGEYLRLLNLFPGNPPIPRWGCPGSFLTFSSTDDRFIPPALITAFKGTTQSSVIVWLIDDSVGNKYTLILFAADGSGSITSLGEAIQTNLRFTLLSMFSHVYCLINKELLTWKGYTYARGHKVIETPGIVRDLCIGVTSELPRIQATTGGEMEAGFYDYAFQYVRRNDQNAFDAAGTTPSGMILPEGIYGEPKRIDTFLPGLCIGVEDPDQRQTIELAEGNNAVTVYTQPARPVDWTMAMAQGATHLRVSRSSRQDTAILSQGATHYFLFDLPISVDTDSFTDELSNAALVGGEMNQLITGYTVAPAAGYGKYVKGRLFLLADTGVVYYSEVPGGGGGAVDLELAEAYPNAWASLFKPTSYFIDCDQNDYSRASGVEVLENDIYFFKENKIFVLFGGDPTATAITKISNEEGCPFPQSICKIKIDGQDAIFFLGTNGPKVIASGGRISDFSTFKIKQLWPDIEDELYGELADNYDWIIDNCCAFYFADTVWVIYQNSAGTNKMFGYFVSPTNENFRGCMEIAFKLTNIIPRIPAKDIVNNKAYLLGSSRQATPPPTGYGNNLLYDSLTGFVIMDTDTNLALMG